MPLHVRHEAWFEAHVVVNPDDPDKKKWWDMHRTDELDLYEEGREVVIYCNKLTWSKELWRGTVPHHELTLTLYGTAFLDGQWVQIDE